MNVTQFQESTPSLFEGLAAHPWLTEPTQQAYVGDQEEFENDPFEHHTWPLATCSLRCHSELPEESASFNGVRSLSPC